MEFFIIKDKEKYHFDLIRDNIVEYVADYEFKGFKKSILFKKDDRNICRIIPKFSLWRKKYTLSFFEGKDHKLINTNVLKMTYELRTDNAIYDIHGHTGKKFSIFKNQKQVAALVGNIRETDAHSGYRLNTNHDADLDNVLSISIALIDSIFENIKVATSARDKGKYESYNTTVALGGRKFDDDWRPSEA
jgi:uncharacterized protein YxjI